MAHPRAGRNDNCMGFYIRKGFNFGPLRLNLSRSGLGASVGVRGARVGIGPHGSYVHLGRGGFYYRKSLGLPSTHGLPQIPASPSQPVTDGLQEISSADANSIVDGSAADLLQELNRINRRFDLFPFIAIVGAGLFLAVLLTGAVWWLEATTLLAVVALAAVGRHYDVTNGTALLNYCLTPTDEAEFSKLQSAFQDLLSCRMFWHLDAAGYTSDWKRNAGASSLVARSEAQSLLSLPPKVVCNLNVPTIKSKQKSLYFFPDRLLVYDASGIGAVAYSELQFATSNTKYVEDGPVPGDSPQVGTTWRYVAKNGGPDRRFKNNRQLPILQYGILALKSYSGLSELFQCSAPNAPYQFVAEVVACGQRSGLTGGGVTFEAPRHKGASWIDAVLGLATAGMAVAAVVLFWNMLPQGETPKQREARLQASRIQFAAALSQSIAVSAKHKNVSVVSTSDGLLFAFTNEGPKAARRDGLTPFNKNIFFSEFLTSNSESQLCSLGFEKLEFSSNGKSLPFQLLGCLGSTVADTQ
jgi:hypothetical protein